MIKAHRISDIVYIKLLCYEKIKYLLWTINDN